jgi:DNA polymerase III subunit delta'
MMNLKDFIGNPRVVDVLRRAVEQGRLPHALIFAGPEGVGKTTLAILLAQMVNCPNVADGDACGRCPSCLRIFAVGQARELECTSPVGKARCGACRNCRTVASQHPDIRIIQPDEKTIITVDQVRNIIREITYQPFEAACRVAILDPADQMKPEGMNSLLKTLEEPPSRTIMVLITTNPLVLPVTIRSRSRLLRFGEIPQDQIEKYLVEKRKWNPVEAGLAALFSDGSLGDALRFNAGQFMELRSLALRFLSLWLGHSGFGEASRIAGAVAKDKDQFLSWLDAVDALLRDLYYALSAPERIAQQDIREEILNLSRRTSSQNVASAVKGVKRLRGSLAFNVNRQMALESIFLDV